MHGKKGQIAVYIIIGLIIIATFSILMYTRQKKVQVENPADISLPMKFSSIDKHVQTCLETTTDDGIRTIALQGGSNPVTWPYLFAEYNVLENLDRSKTSTFAMSLPFLFVNYQLYEGKRYHKFTADDLSANLAVYIQDRLPSCVGNLKQFEVWGVKAKTGHPEVKVDVEDDKVIVDVHYVMTFSIQDAVHAIDNIQTVRNARLDFIATKFIDELIDIIKQDPDKVFVTQISDAAAKYGFEIDVLSFKDSYIYVIRDARNQVEHEPLIYLIAVQRPLGGGYEEE